jgi:hypothetical protein
MGRLGTRFSDKAISLEQIGDESEVKIMIEFRSLRAWLCGSGCKLMSTVAMEYELWIYLPVVRWLS